jgi:NtrC-family two-component system response regulator AlgB
LFLDEVADLSADAQARLLRFLNDRTYERVGEPKERQAHVRLIAATNRHLEEEVRAGRFREDLFFRLHVITLTLPALRERPEDLLPLARHFLGFCERRQGRQHLSLSQRCEQAISAYPWPGNLRELRNAVERAVILSPASIIEAADLGLPSPDARTKQVAAEGEAGGGNKIFLGAEVTLEEIEREHIARIVASAASFEAAARTLGIDITTLQRKRKRYGLA